MIKLYVGCGLTRAPEDFKQKVEELKEKFKKIPSVQVLEFLGTTTGTARDVYNHDIVNCVGECDMLVAICDEPSTGLGGEMFTQNQRGKPQLAFGHVDSQITKMILDPPWENYRFIRYQSFDDIYQIVEEAIKNLLANNAFAEGAHA